jgi:HSF-type DNA-binding
MTAQMSTAYSGLSALIQAATSQLGHLVDNALDHIDDHVSDGSHLTSPTLEGGYASAASSDFDLREALSPTTCQTPLIVTEQDPTATAAAGKLLSFPEELMTLLLEPRNEDVITFLPDGKYFAIRRREFTENLLQKHFRLTTFEEFLEMIRGWGFARINSNEDAEEGDRNHDHHCSSNGEHGNVNGNVNGNDSTTTIASNHSSARAAIHVFRRHHFSKDEPVDMNKIKFGNKGRDHSHEHQIVSDAAASMLSISSETCPRTIPPIPSTPRVVENSMSDDSSSSFLNTKRRLSPSHLDRDSAEGHDPKGQRMLLGEHHKQASSSSHADHHVPPPILTAISSSHDSNDLPPPVVRRRSSIELRGKALAITTSKLNLQSGEGPDEDDDELDDDGETLASNNRNGGMSGTASSSSYTSTSHSGLRAHRKHERKLSSATLVDGAVEAATHTIVTDAIETLLFDESHTRETYLKHEKELSVSSLPGVVPISKQLFASKNPTDSSGASGASVGIGDGYIQSKTRNKFSSKPKPTVHTDNKKKGSKKSQQKPMDTTSSPSSAVHTASSGLLATDGAPPRPRVVTIVEPRSVASPARLEAAVALMEQSQMVDDVTRSAASKSEY